MAYGVVVKNSVAAQDVTSYNRKAIAGSAVNIDNGNVFNLTSKSATAGYSEVWSVAVSGSAVAPLWMAYSPEVVVVSVGTKQYRLDDPDPQDFTNLGGLVLDCFLPKVGDIVTFTAENFTGTPASAYANSGSAVYTLNWAAAQVTGAQSWRYLATTYISRPSGSIDTGRLTAYQMECIYN